MRGSVQEELAASLIEILRRIRLGGDVNKSEIGRLVSKAASLDDPYLKRHLLTVLWEMEKGNYRENDLLGKLISYDSSELPKILDALQEFSHEDPFDGLEIKEIIEFWKLVLRSLGREGRSAKGSTS